MISLINTNQNIFGQMVIGWLQVNISRAPNFLLGYLMKGNSESHLSPKVRKMQIKVIVLYFILFNFIFNLLTCTTVEDSDNSNTAWKIEQNGKFAKILMNIKLLIKNDSQNLHCTNYCT